MPITVTCPNCSAKMKAPDTTAGKKIKCPKCQAAITVPEPEADFEPDHRLAEPVIDHISAVMLVEGDDLLGAGARHQAVALGQGDRLVAGDAAVDEIASFIQNARISGGGNVPAHSQR